MLKELYEDRKRKNVYGILEFFYKSWSRL